MAKKEIRFGGGLNLVASTDAIKDDELLKAQGVVFDDPGALKVEIPPKVIQGNLLYATALGTRYDSVQGIADAFTLDSGSGAHYIYLKNQHCWQQVTYDGVTIRNIPVSDYSATLLAAGNNAASYTGAVAYYRVPSNGTLVLKLWGAGGGGGVGIGYGTGNGGGAGGFATSSITVSAGDIVTIYIGRGGDGGLITNARSSGGYPDGGNAAIHSYSGVGAGGGGGSTRAYINGTLALVAGAGGGAGHEAGSGGGTTGGNDANSGGTGGGQAAGGIDASDVLDSLKWGASFSGGFGGTDSSVDAGGGGGGGYYGGGGGGGAAVATARGGGGGSGYLGGLGTSESFTTNPTGTQSPAPNSGDAAYSATAGRRTGNPNSDTATGGYSDATNPATANANPGGDGYGIMNFTSGGGGGSIGGPGSTGNHQLSAIRYNGFVYLCDGYAFRKFWYDGSTWQTTKVGCPRPTSAPSGADYNPGGAFGVAAIVYKYAYTYCRIDSSNNILVESNMSPLLSYTCPTTGHGCTLTITADSSGGTQTNARAIYRSNENGDAMFFVALVADNTTLTYNDTMGVSALKGDPTVAVSAAASGVKLSGIPLNNQTIGDAKFERNSSSPFKGDAEQRGDVWYTNLGVLADWYDHDFPWTATGSVDGEGQIRNLRLLDDCAYGIFDNTTLGFTTVGNVEYWSPFRRVIVGRNSGEKLMDIQPLDKDMICYTDRAIYRFRRFGIDATESTLEKVADIGTPSENAVAVTDNNGHVFMGWDGVYQFDGRTVRKISTAINEMWRDSTLSDYVYPTTRSYAVAGGKDDRVWFGYRAYSAPSGVDLYQNYLLHCDLRSGEPKWATSNWNISSLHRGYDHTMFAGNETDDLQIIDYTSFSNVEQTVIRTKLYPTGANIKNRAYPEKLFLDLDLAGQSAAVVVYANDYSTRLYAFTITGSLERRVYTKTLPFNMANRLGVQITIQSASSTTYQPRIFGMGWFDNGQEAED